MQAIPDDEEMQRYLQPQLEDKKTYKTIETQTSVNSKHPEKETMHFIENEAPDDQRKDQTNQIGITTKILNRLPRFRKQAPVTSKDNEDKKNSECQTEKFPVENGEQMINEEITECPRDVSSHTLNTA